LGPHMARSSLLVLPAHRMLRRESLGGDILLVQDSSAISGRAIRV